MKKLLGFMGVVAMLTFASCSNDNFDEPNMTPDQQGDLFLTMNITPASNVGTRTATPNQGYEVGKERENTIGSALIILAKGSEAAGYEVVATSGDISSGNLVGDPSGAGAGQGHGADADAGQDGIQNDGYDNGNALHSNSYKASFTFTRSILQEDIKNNGAAVEGTDSGLWESDAETPTKKITYAVFVIANPTEEIKAAAAAAAAPGATNKDVQQVFTASSNTYRNAGIWKDGEFLMSNSRIAEVTIFDTEIALGRHTKKAEALHLGTVQVQRAMSRFDLATSPSHTSFEKSGSESSDDSEPGPSTLDVKVEFDAVAMVNMAKTAYLYKTMALNQTNLDAQGTNNTLKVFFGNERDASFANNWVFSPNQSEYFNPLFTLTSNSLDKYVGSSVGFETLFENGKDFQWISTLTEEDNTFEHEQHAQGIGNYNIWRYCMENTNPDITDNQKNANSTGIVFRAKLTGEKIPETGSDPIYAYGNVVLGTADDLYTYATSPKSSDDNTGVYESVRSIYYAAMKKAVADNIQSTDDESGEITWKNDGGWKTDDDGNYVRPTAATEDEIAAFDTFLVGQDFGIYRPTMTGDSQDVPVYYCYYLYWNRHNDNSQNTIMGIMEFATVRNNVYKISVNKVLHLGHPGKPGDDPDDPDPDDPDEKDEFWIDVDCQILPWEVRINNVEL